MESREFLVSALTQMIAPRLFVLSGDNPAEMGFPFAEDRASLDERLERQFSPVDFWTGKAREIAEGVVDVIYRGSEVPPPCDLLTARSAEYAMKWQPEAVT